MKLCIVNCFDLYDKRVQYIEKVFLKKGIKVVILVSDFDHARKRYLKTRDNVEYIHSHKYKKNLSYDRLYSHYSFSKDVYGKLNEEKPDFIYALIPPNSVAKAVIGYQVKNCETKVFFDIIDMWPESLPVKKNFITFPFFKIWQSLRNRYLNCADVVFTECNLYQIYLKNVVSKEKFQTLYLVKEKGYMPQRKKLNSEKIVFAYLGSINHLIDMQLLCEIIEHVVKRKKVALRIIGTGENKNELIRRIERLGAEVIDEGIIYDEVQKRDILQQCNFGINIMKESVCIGLTTKSIDYFSVGLPIINNIKGDSKKIVSRYCAGVNIDKDCKEEVVEKICNISENEYNEMCDSSYRVYLENLAPEIFMKNLEKKIQSYIENQENGKLARRKNIH